MHPIERLRYVARASGVDQGLLVRETAEALAALGFDPSGMVIACRRMVDRHPTSGPMWWLCSRMLTASEPRREAWRCVDEIEVDTTSTALARALPDDATVCVVGWGGLLADALARRGDLRVLVVDDDDTFARRLRRRDVAVEAVGQLGLGAAAGACDLVLLEADAVGPGSALGPAGARAAAAVAAFEGRPTWLVAGVGRTLPEPVWRALASRFECEAPWEQDQEVLPLSLVTETCGPDGLAPAVEAATRSTCPVAPELFRPSA